MTTLKKQAIKIMEKSFNTAIDNAVAKWGRNRTDFNEKVINHLKDQKIKVLKRFNDFSGDPENLLKGAQKNGAVELMNNSHTKVLASNN